jgi:hypothetical protein
MKFNEFRININKRVVFLEKEAGRVERKYVKTGKVIDRMIAIDTRSGLEELRKVIKDLNTLEP